MAKWERSSVRWCGHIERGFWVSFNMFEFHDLASSSDGSGRVSFGFVAGVPVLDTYVEEGFGAEVSHIHEGRFRYGGIQVNHQSIRGNVS